MEGLFTEERKKKQRLLAVMVDHTNPVNCVRWNNIGTLFASAADDGSVILWEYVGEMMATSAFQRYQMQQNMDTGNKRPMSFEESKTQGQGEN